MYGFGGVGLSEVQISISELSVVGGWWWVGGWWTGQTHFMVGPGRGPTIILWYCCILLLMMMMIFMTLRHYEEVLCAYYIYGTQTIFSGHLSRFRP